jgi:hypothetical protein
MNCGTFHRKINDLLEEDCLIDFKNSMEEHRDNCDECKAYYEEELEISKDFKQFFSVEGIEFKSSRAEILDAINKNQYKNNYLIQIYTHFSKHKKKYIAWAAVFAMIFLVGPNIAKLFEANKINFANATSSSAATESKSSTAAMQDSSIMGDVNNITFQKLELQASQNIIPKDIWKNSADSRYSACISGKSTNQVFIGKNIYVKDNSTGKLWSFTINNASNEQNAPLFLEWSQKNEGLILIIGKATGTITEGGDIYFLNIDSAMAKLIYKPSQLEKIKDFKSINGGLNAEIIVYEDSSFTAYHIENIKISSEDLNNMAINMSTLPKAASIIFEYQEDINNNRLEAAIKLISKKHIDNKAFDYNKLLYDIDRMNISSLKKVSSSYDINPVTMASFQHEAFLAEVYYDLKSNINTDIKGGENSIMVVLVKDNIDSSWKIGEINRVK